LIDFRRTVAHDANDSTTKKAGNEGMDHGSKALGESASNGLSPQGSQFRTAFGGSIASTPRGHFSGRLNVIIQNGTILESAFEDGYATGKDDGRLT
jgi:hypothetical protein